MFQTDLSNPYIAKAAELRAIFDQDAAARDRQGGRPDAQIALLKESGLLNAVIPAEYGGGGQPYSVGLRIVREFAKTDGSLAHLYGYHVGLVAVAERMGDYERAPAIYRESVAGNWLWGNSANSFSNKLFGVRQPDGGYVLDGTQPFSSGSHVADRLIVRWFDQEAQANRIGVLPTAREGVIVEDDWDAIGQRQTGSGNVTFRTVRVDAGELLHPPEQILPIHTLTGQNQQSVLMNVFIGSAQGAIEAARNYTLGNARPWVHSGVDRHIDDPWIRRKYGQFYTATRAATLFADEVGTNFDSALARRQQLTAQERGQLAIDVASAASFAAETALKVTSEIFEVMGARSAMSHWGFDRFWRNVRIHTLHDPVEYKVRNTGYWVLTGEYPDPTHFQ